MSGPLPHYVCALLQDPSGWWVLQLRPLHARHAPGQLTCFGGAREAGEDIETCLRRELHEELGWQPGALGAACELWQQQTYLACFRHCRLDVPWPSLRTERGQVAVRVPTPALAGVPLSPWHRAVLRGVGLGQRRVEVD